MRLPSLLKSGSRGFCDFFAALNPHIEAALLYIDILSEDCDKQKELRATHVDTTPYEYADAVRGLCGEHLNLSHINTDPVSLQVAGGTMSQLFASFCHLRWYNETSPEHGYPLEGDN